jgi:hypothetical protein
MFTKVMSFYKEHRDRVELFVSVYDPQKVSRIPLSKYLARYSL